jgi:PmbA protein
MVVREVDSSLTRFANNGIHQNVAERGTHWRARVSDGHRTGVAESSGDTPETGSGLLSSARDVMRLQDSGDTPPLPEPDGGGDDLVAYSENTAHADPDVRAAMVEQIVAAASARGLQAFGYVSNQTVHAGRCHRCGARR